MKKTQKKLAALDVTANKNNRITVAGLSLSNNAPQVFSTLSSVTTNIPQQNPNSNNQTSNINSQNLNSNSQNSISYSLRSPNASYTTETLDYLISDHKYGKNK